MAKRTAKAAKKGTRPAARAKTRPGGASRKKPARRGDGTHVSFGIHGLARIVHAVKEARLEKEFDKAVGKDGTFVKVSRKGMANIHNFVQKQPELADLATEMNQCNCPPNDPYCRYFLP